MKCNLQITVEIDPDAYWLPVDREKANEVIEDELINLFQELDGMTLKNIEIDLD